MTLRKQTKRGYYCHIGDRDCTYILCYFEQCCVKNAQRTQNRSSFTIGGMIP